LGRLKSKNEVNFAVGPAAPDRPQRRENVFDTLCVFVVHLNRRFPSWTFPAGLDHRMHARSLSTHSALPAVTSDS